MSRFLLDVNVLIALIDTVHVQHKQAHAWFEQRGKHSWATCPITENGLLRIVGHSRYPNSPGTPAVVAELMVRLRVSKNHEFWPDNLSLLGNTQIDLPRLLAPAQITDTYLLALASAHGGKLATFDHRLVASAVIGGRQALHLIH